jgi:hypothetical protein
MDDKELFERVSLQIREFREHIERQLERAGHPADVRISIHMRK